MGGGRGEGGGAILLWVCGGQIIFLFAGVVWGTKKLLFLPGCEANNNEKNNFCGREWGVQTKKISFCGGCRGLWR